MGNKWALPFIACAAAFLLPPASDAQQPAWPSRVVRIIATSPPGGSIDFLARAVAEECTRAFGQPFIVENRPGANGNIGVELVLRAPPDGHMLFVTAPGPWSKPFMLRQAQNERPVRPEPRRRVTGQLTLRYLLHSGG